MHYTELFSCKTEKKMLTFFFNMFVQHIDCGYMLEQRSGCNEYPQSMFWSKSKKNRRTPVLYKVEFNGV